MLYLEPIFLSHLLSSRFWNCSVLGDNNMEGDVIEGLVDCVCRDEVVQAINEMETGKVSTA